MARSQEEWDEKIKKHGHGIDVELATTEELEDFVATKMHVHAVEDFTDFPLWDCAREEFEQFTVDTFRQLRVDTRTKLRNHFIQRGVFVKLSQSRYTNSHALYDVLHEDEYHEWTNEDLDTLREPPKRCPHLQERWEARKRGATTTQLPPT